MLEERYNIITNTCKNIQGYVNALWIVIQVIKVMSYGCNIMRKLIFLAFIVKQVYIIIQHIKQTDRINFTVILHAYVCRH